MNERQMPVEFLAIRDQILADALAHVANLKGKKQDVAFFDYLCGCCKVLYRTGEFDTELPGFLFVIGVRGGDRIAEAKRMIGEVLGQPKEAEPAKPASGDDGSKEPAAKK